MSAAVALEVSCGCGTRGSLPALGARYWTCPTCHTDWRPDDAANAQVSALGRQLYRLRLLAVGVPLAVGVLVALLAIWRPALIITAPLAAGLAMVVLRRWYRSGLLSIYRQLPEFTLVRAPR